MRILGLDYGSKTVGVAVSDGEFSFALPVETIKRDSENKLRRTLARIEELIKEYEACGLVLGLPVNMDGSAGERAEKTLEFKEKLEARTGLPVYLQDERLTTQEAEEELYEMGVKRCDMKKYVDQVAAACILQDYLNGRK